MLSPSGKFQDLRASLCILELSKQPDVANTHAATPSPAASHCTARRASPAGTAEIAPRPCALVSLCQPTRAGRTYGHGRSRVRSTRERSVSHGAHTGLTRARRRNSGARGRMKKRRNENAPRPRSNVYIFSLFGNSLIILPPTYFSLCFRCGSGPFTCGCSESPRTRAPCRVMQSCRLPELNRN